MKKWLLSLMAVMLIGALSGCGADEDSSDERIYVGNLDVKKYVTLGQYKELEIVSAPATEVTREMVEAQTLQLYLNYVTKENGGITDRAIKEGDTVIFDYVGRKDGVAFDGGTAENANLTIGSNSFIPGFETGMIGLKPGETADLNLTFPDSYYNNEMAGQAVVFTVTIHYILPDEVEDDVVAAFGSSNYSNKKEMSAYVESLLKAQAASEKESAIQTAIMSKLVENATFKKLPEDMVKQYEEDIMSMLTSSASSYGVDVNTLTETVYEMSADTYAKAAAEDTVKQFLAAQAVAEAEGFVLTEEQLDEEIMVLAVENGWNSVAEFTAQYDRETVRESIMYQTVRDFLRNSAVVTENIVQE